VKIVVVDHVYLDETHVRKLKTLGEVRIFSDPPNSDAELKRRIENAEIVIVGWSHLTEEIIKSAPNLRMIAIWATTCHYADLNAAKERRITVTHVPRYATEAVAEHAFALLLASIRHLVPADKHVREGKFDWRPFSGSELAEKTLGLVGTGAIGFRVAEIAKAFKMRILGFDIVHNMERAKDVGLEFVDLPTLLRESDVVSIHLTLTPTTTGLIGRREIEMMKKGAVLVNTAQGKVVDERALIDALKSGRLSYAGLDVFAEEPIGEGSLLFGLENTVLSPHIGFQTVEAVKRCTDICIENVSKFIEGHQQNLCP
jgi:D-3-phosphoglycerate dehydrogenase